MFGDPYDPHRFVGDAATAAVIAKASAGPIAWILLLYFKLIGWMMRGVARILHHRWKLWLALYGVAELSFALTPGGFSSVGEMIDLWIFGIEPYSYAWAEFRLEASRCFTQSSPWHAAHAE